MSSATLHLGDCLEIMPTFEDCSFDAILCDLPYGTTACKWDTVIPFELLWEQYKRIIKPKGAIVLFGSQPFTSSLVMSNLEWFRWEDIWEKSRPVGFLDANRRPLRAHENILIFSNGCPTYNPQKWKIDPLFIDRRKTFTVLEDSTPVYHKRKAKSKRPDDGTRYPLSVIPINSMWARGQHPTQKPVPLLEYLIRTYTNEGDTVLDNCFGSGTTGVACVNTNRNFVGIEILPEYFKVGEQRIEHAQNQAGQLEFDLMEQHEMIVV